MELIETGFDGLFILEPKVLKDHRGYFFESFNLAKFRSLGLGHHFVQDNEAKSVFGVLRGLHYQVQPQAQAKLVRVISGEVLDVVVDLRENSATYGRHFKIRLNGEEKKQLLVPEGFAHGYVVLSPEAVFAYKCTDLYAPDLEGGIHYADPKLNIDWEIDPQKILISTKDDQQPHFGQHRLF